MKRKATKLLSYLLVFIMAVCLFIPVFQLEAPQAAKKATDAKIHFLNLKANTDAILLECNGAFGMVDSGEDNSYPKGNNPRYPWRAGIVKGNGVEADVISYLKELGVKRLDFYIATHPHSDHIGNANKIIKEFKPKRVYIRPYKDSYITNRTRLWDNLYVYDNLIKAVKDVNKNASGVEDGITLIQYFNPGAAYVDPLRKDKTGSNSSSSSSNKAAAAKKPAAARAASEETLGAAAPAAPDSEETLGAAAGTPPVVEEGAAPEDSIVSEETTVSGETAASEETASPEETTTSEETTSPEEAADTPDSAGSPDTEASDSEETSLNTETDDAPGETMIPEDPVKNINTTEKASAEDIEEVLQGEITDLDTLNDDQLEEETQENLAEAGIETLSLAEEAPAVVDQTPFEENLGIAPASIKLTGNSKPQKAKPKFTLGDGMTVEIMNYSAKLKAPDANYFCLGVKVTANGSSAFLAGDINNYNGTEDKLAKKLGRVDVLKLGHHGFYGSNSTRYLKKLRPKIAILMGTTDHCKKSMFDTLSSMGARVYATPLYAGSTKATVVNLNRSVSSNISKTSLSKKIVSAYSTELKRYVLYRNGRRYVGSGWVKAGNKLYYFNPKTKKMKTNQWWKRKGKYYYFNPNGSVATGWYKWNDKWYYSASNGVMQKGWLKDGKKVYYLTKTGEMVTGDRKIGRHWYYFRSNGSMYIGWLNNKFFYNEKGRWIKNKKPTGWQKDDVGYWWRYRNGSYPKNTFKTIKGKKYYFNNKGYRVTGLTTVKGKKYYFSSSGVMEKGLKTINGKKYYFASSGIMQTGLQTISGKKYYFASNGIMQTGLQTIGGKRYYFASNGIMQTGWKTISGKQYYFGSNGIMQTEWKTISGKQYYFGSNGIMQTGPQSIGGKQYFFASNGIMQTGWQKVGSKSYYYDASTGVQNTSTGFVDIQGKTYYLNSDSSRLETAGRNDVNKDGTIYYFDDDYSLHYGWLAQEGTSETGEVIINYYYFYDKTDAFPEARPGAMAVDTTLDLPAWEGSNPAVYQYEFDADGLATELSVRPDGTPEETPDEAPQDTPEEPIPSEENINFVSEFNEDALIVEE